jgi:hypothetical protein
VTDNFLDKMRRVHCKVAEYDVYIGRPSKWGNPFTHKPGTLAQNVVETRELAVSSYRDWILKQPELLQSLPELKGKVLGCWCPANKACHGDVLIELVNQYCNDES